MPLRKVIVQNGVNQQQTQTLNATSWWATNLIRFRDGMIEKIGGWSKLFTTQLAGLARSLHAFEDLTTANNLLIGTDGGPQVYVNGVLYDFSVSDYVSYVPALSSPNTLYVVGGSSTATVLDPNYVPTVGQQVLIGIPFYLNVHSVFPTIVTVTGASGSPPTGTWTFTLPWTATGPPAQNGALPPLFGPPNIGTNIIEVHLAFHGFTSPGQIFTVNYPVLFTGGGSASVPAGNYPILSIIDPDHFTIAGTSLSNGNEANGYESPNGGTGKYFAFTYLNTTATFPDNVDWYTDNFGGSGIVSFTMGGIYEYNPPIVPPNAILSPITNAPIVNNGVLVAMPQAQIVAWGSTPVLNTSTQDPLFLRWCDAGDPTTWTATVSNQAGSFRLSRGSKIVGGIQVALTTLIFTDTDVWSMQYVGPPFVYDFTVMASGCGMIAPKACAILGGNAYWMSQKNFYSVGSGGVQEIYCPVWDFIFNNIDQNNLAKINMGANSGFGELILFFPSASGGTGEVDSYVKWKPATGEWDYGTNTVAGSSHYARTAWLDQSVFGSAMGGDLNMKVQQHETGYDADGTPMSGVLAETGYSDLSDGDEIMFLHEIEPDMKWFGTVPGAIELTLKSVNYAQGPITRKGPYGMDMANKLIRPRIRGRSIALRWDWVSRLGYNARIGAVKVRAQASGRRP